MENKTEKTVDYPKKILSILEDFDRMKGNPDLLKLEEIIREQIESEGILKLSIIACPSYTPSALLTDKPEEYFPVCVNTPDLFTPRVSKINKMCDALNSTGIRSKIIILIGDTDPVDYVLPALKRFRVEIKTDSYRDRVMKYLQSFEARAESMLKVQTETYSLLDLGFGEYSLPFLDINSTEIAEEVNFLKWLFSKEGPYKELFPLSSGELNQMANIKFEQYARQGYILQNLTGRILLQTETPWLLRTKMLKAGGADFAAIYPWIRTEEL